MNNKKTKKALTLAAEKEEEDMRKVRVEALIQEFADSEGVSREKVLEKMQGGAPLKTEVYNREQTQLLATGELTSLDNQIDPATGTLRLKAELTNDDSRLFPNQFVNVRLLIDVVPKAVVVPAAGVRRGPQGAQSYVLRDDDTVDLRKVDAGESIRDEVIIRSGVQAGERVVVEGSERLRNGVQVEVKEADSPDRQQPQKK